MAQEGQNQQGQNAGTGSGATTLDYLIQVGVSIYDAEFKLGQILIITEASQLFEAASTVAA